jgi:hypothetical protein
VREGGLRRREHPIVVARIWHMQDSHGQNLALAFMQRSLKPLKVSSLRSIEQLLRRNVKRFRGGLVFTADILLYHSTLGLRAIKKDLCRSAIAASVAASSRSAQHPCTCSYGGGMRERTNPVHLSFYIFSIFAHDHGGGVAGRDFFVTMSLSGWLASYTPS